MMRWLIPALLLPCAALAEPWHGIWAGESEWCRNADRIGSVTPAPIALTADEVLGYENSCTVNSAQELPGMNTWQLSISCQSEGDTFDEERLVMVGDNTLWMWWGAGEPIRFERCPE